MKVRITFTEPLLGTLASQTDVAKDFILGKHPNGEQPDEVSALPDESKIAVAMTTFSRTPDGLPMLWDYQIKGFLKEACHQMILMETFTKEDLKKVGLGLWQYKRTIDQLLFPQPRRIPLVLPTGTDPARLSIVERPLRAETMQGPRIAVARSESAPAGTYIDCAVIVMRANLAEFVRNWLTSGELKGLGQWRNSGMGRFTWSAVE